MKAKPIKQELNHIYSCNNTNEDCVPICTAWKVSKYGVFSGLYFPAFGLTMEKKLRIWTLFTQCIYQRCSVEKVSLKILLNSQENTRLRPATLLQKRLWHWCFPVNLAKFLRTIFLIEHLWWPVVLVQNSIFQFTPVRYKSSPQWVFLRKNVLKKCSKFTGEHPRKVWVQ